MAGHRIRQERVAKGLCATCGKPRGEDGTRTQCRPHADQRNKRQARRNAQVRAFRRARHLCIECGVKLSNKKDKMCAIHKIKKSHTDRRYRMKPSSY